jgi:hypothetical protein
MNRSCKTYVSKRAGLAMVEMVTALFIVSFGVFSVLTMYHVGISKARALKSHQQVMNALQNEIAGLRAVPFDALPSSWQGGFRESAPSFQGLVGAKPRLRIRPLEKGRTDLLEIRASIRWRGENGRMIEKSLATLIADKRGTGQ